MKKWSDKFSLKAIIGLALLAFVTSLYLIREHYNEGSSPICEFGANISCSLVNSSVFSVLFNVPVALFGALWAVMLGYFAWKAMKNKDMYLALLGWSVVGFISVLYFVMAEYIVGALCTLCTVVHIIVIVVLVLSVKLYSSLEKKPKWEDIKKKMGGPIMFLIIFMITAFILFNLSSNAPEEDLTSFANCLTDKGIAMYSSFTCGNCVKQKEYFGEYFEFIEEVECHPDGDNSQNERCIEKDIAGTPTWVWEENNIEMGRLVGVQDLEELSIWSGCSMEVVNG